MFFTNPGLGNGAPRCQDDSWYRSISERECTSRRHVVVSLVLNKVSSHSADHLKRWSTFSATAQLKRGAVRNQEPDLVPPVHAGNRRARWNVQRSHGGGHATTGRIPSPATPFPATCTMDKMAILAAITTEPSISLHQRPDLLPNLWPSEVRPQQGNLLNGASFFVVLRTYFAASVAVKSMARLGTFVALPRFLVTRFLAIQAASMTSWLSWMIWNTAYTQRLRKRVEYEFFTLVLGSGGNALCLMVFWPGWIFLALTWTIWSLVV